MATREQLLSETFIDLADTLAGDYEVNEFLQLLVDRCAQILDVTTAGVMLETSRGHLRLVVGVSPEMEALEQAEIDNEDGPCHEAYRTGVPVVADDLANADAQRRWPSVTPLLCDMGLRGAYAFPLRLRSDCIGALNLYRDMPGEFAAADIRLGQAFADFAAIGILQQRKLDRAEQRAEQLQHAFDSRVLIEQAKGIVSVARSVSPSDAFEQIRAYARSHNLRVHDVSRAIVDQGPSALDAS